MKKVLFIDDEPLRASSYAMVADIDIAHGGSQVEFYLKRYKYDLIMIDHDMPLMSGPLVINNFWRELKKQDCKVLIHSANSMGAHAMYKSLTDFGIEAHVDALPCLLVFESYLGLDEDEQDDPLELLMTRCYALFAHIRDGSSLEVIQKSITTTRRLMETFKD